MAQSASSLASVLKDAWTSERIQKQFEAENAPLNKIEQFKGTMIGQQAQVPIYNNRSFAFTSTGAAGGVLNPAQQQQVNQATFSLAYNWFQVALEASALAQATSSGAQAIISAKDLEIQGAVENTRHQMTRMAVTNGDGIVAACATGGASTTVSLVPQASEGSLYGYSSLIRGWVGSQATVDIGTTADTDSLVTASAISAVSLSATAPSITIGSSISTTQGTHFVYIPNPNSATAANAEMNGLRQLVNTTGAFGGLNPATAGQEFWQAAARDTTTTALSLDLMLGLNRGVMQNSNKGASSVWTSYKQEANFYGLLQNQVRFNGDGNLGAGNVSAPKWNGMEIEAFADVLDTDMFFLTLADLCKVTGGWDAKPMWASDLQGATNGQLWSPGTTQFVDALCYPMQLGANRRNTHAAATALQ
jgi:hypothetical protein